MMYFFLYRKQPIHYKTVLRIRIEHQDLKFPLNQTVFQGSVLDPVFLDGRIRFFCSKVIPVSGSNPHPDPRILT